MYHELLERKKILAVIGLGYVGLPIALEFAKKIKVIGFDINLERVEKMKNRIDPSDELGPEAFDNCDITFTADPEDLRKAGFYIITVPTPIDEYNKPDLRPLLSATSAVGNVLKKGDFVVYESTVYPGCTEEDCVPVLEKNSGLKFRTDFKVGFSPERINPGDKLHTLTKILKVTSGCDAESSDEITKVYKLIIEAGVFEVSSIKVAEAAKIIENTQRDINIAFMNELSMIFNKMGINTFEVLEAAGTKWNFLKFQPGLVGGHCIGVDPYYLTYKSSKFGHHAQIITAGRSINDGMGEYIARQLIRIMIDLGKNLKESKILVMGITFKENVTDIRNSKVVDVIRELRNFNLNVDIVDPLASPEAVKKEYGLEMTRTVNPPYDAVIVAVKHNEYLSLDERYFIGITKEPAVLFDLKGIYLDKIDHMRYWTL